MDSCKYIVYEDREYGCEVIALFSPIETHADFARRLGVQPTSAGFLRLKPSTNGVPIILAECYGESVSLKLKSDQEKDSRLANKLLGIM